MTTQITASNFTPTLAATLSVPKITSISYPGDDLAADTAGGQTISLTGLNFTSTVTVLIGTSPISTASVVSVISSTSITFTAPAAPAGNYIVYVINSDGSTAIAVPGISYSGTPTWTTAAGSLGTAPISTSVNFTVAATGDAPITYSLYSGTLPSGVTLNTSTGVISGTAPILSSSTTYNFVIRATDGQKQDTDRSFSLAVSVIVAPSTVEYLVVAGGGGGGGGDVGTIAASGGGGAGGYVSGSLSIVQGVTYTVTVGAGGNKGIFTSGSGTVPTSGSNSALSTITAIGGGYGGHQGAQGATVADGAVGGSGGGGASGTTTGANVGSAGTSGQGNAGGAAVSGAAGGGGGAGAAGGNGVTGVGGGGGAGKQWLDGNYYAGGGGGASRATQGAGGIGGGSAATNSTNTPDATPNTGGGGGGVVGAGTNSAAKGGSGVVIIRYADTFDPAVAATGTVTVTVSGGYRVYKFTSSGTITF